MRRLLRRRPAWVALVCAVVIAAALPATLVAQEFPPPTPSVPLRDGSAPPAAPPAPEVDVLPEEVEAASVDPALLDPTATSRIYAPLIGNNSTLATVPPSALPTLVNGFFDGAGGWSYLRGGVAYDLTWPANSTQLGSFGISSLPRVLWLGGGSVIDGVFVPEPEHRVTQTVRLPADYNVRLQFDYLPQSLEATCGNDNGGLYANGVLLLPRFRFCIDPGATNTWREGVADLSPWRGQEVTLEFRMLTDAQFNSNLWIDNLQLCGQHSGLRATQQCPAPGWQEVGANAARANGVSASESEAFAPSVAIGQVGRPYVAWSNKVGGSNYEIYVRRWNGFVWESVGATSASGGGISNTPGASLDPTIALARDGTPWVAWHDLVSGSNEVYVRRWDGSAWVEAGAGSASGWGISNNGGDSFGASMVIAADGSPTIAWADVHAGAVNGAADIYVRRWDGSAWAEVGLGSASGGGISNTEGNSLDPSLAIAPNGALSVAWSEETASGEEIYVRRFDGVGWAEAGVSSASGGGISNSPGRSLAPAQTVAPDGALWVAWHDGSNGDNEIYVRRFAGGVWQEVGSASASGGGISRNSGGSLDVALGVSRLGSVYAVWRDQSGFNAEIYGRAWTGSGWQSLSGSAAGSGLSNTSTASTEPAMTVAPDGVPYVVWTDLLGSRGRIYARRYVP